jgi:hypothetical protein
MNKLFVIGEENAAKIAGVSYPTFRRAKIPKIRLRGRCVYKTRDIEFKFTDTYTQGHADLTYDTLLEYYRDSLASMLETKNGKCFVRHLIFGMGFVRSDVASLLEDYPEFFEERDTWIHLKKDAPHFRRIQLKGFRKRREKKNASPRPAKILPAPQEAAPEQVVQQTPEPAKRGFWSRLKNAIKTLF